MSDQPPSQPPASDPYGPPPTTPSAPAPMPSGGTPPAPQPAGGYPPPPPGYPAPTYGGGEYPGSRPNRGNSGLAITALIVSIIALLICWIPVIGAGAAFVSAILAVIAWVVSQRGNRPIGMSVTATVLSVIALLIGIVITIVFFKAIAEDVQEAEDYCQPISNTQREYDDCVGERTADNFLERFGIEPTP